ncbi:uncharacterized protein [Aristolochia californica]|uniref:uncharacterized protein n=1 Tax=Aristolochia californica TaxID=171875 RepID=UPI0035E2EB73
MNLLGSRSVSPTDGTQRRFMSCHTVDIKAYGSDQGGLRHTAYFEFGKYESWEHRAISDLGFPIITTRENVNTPVYFTSDMEFLSQPKDLQSWLDSIFCNSDLFEETQDLIRRELSSFGPEMAKEALGKGFARLDLVVEAQEVVDLNYYEEPEESEEEEEEEEEPGMVPAASSSIESLKMKQIDAEDSKEVCIVCLNQFSVAAAVAQMPCAHIFHKDCIVSWLEKSHVCPLCRFKMPT